ncbi:MAG: hypothetical protein ABW217_03880 [Polyangiaceae bacterium]
MTMTDRPHWNRASLAQQRPLPKPRKMHGPVGEPKKTIGDLVAAGMRGEQIAKMVTRETGIDLRACKCGYHVCSCPPKRSNPLYLSRDQDEEAWLTSGDVALKMAHVKALLMVGKTLRVTECDASPLTIGLRLRANPKRPDRFQYSSGDEWILCDKWSELLSEVRTFRLASYEVLP